MSAPVVLAVDGGNSKTDLALVRGDGALLALVRGPMSSPHHLGVDGCLEVLEDLLGDALAAARIERDGGPVAAVAQLLLAGLDLPEEESALDAAVAERGWAERATVGNDTFAVLRAGTERGWGVAVVCGAGINCLGVAPDGRQVRFPALGAITGDWGGGYDVGMAALSAAARSQDGRGPKTSLEQAVPAHFGMRTPHELAEAIHLRRLPADAVVDLAPVVLAEAAGDAVAAGIRARLASEVVALARVAVARLELAEEPVEVLLGGGLLQAGDGELVDAIAQGLREVGPHVSVRATDVPPILGTALLGLDDLGAGPESHARLRRELVAVVESREEGLRRG
jgi:N-acetylglucosamine kinase-like BadF-type ATPase